MRLPVPAVMLGLVLTATAAAQVEITDARFERNRGRRWSLLVKYDSPQEMAGHALAKLRIVLVPTAGTEQERDAKTLSADVTRIRRSGTLALDLTFSERLLAGVDAYEVVLVKTREDITGRSRSTGTEISNRVKVEVPDDLSESFMGGLGGSVEDIRKRMDGVRREMEGKRAAAAPKPRTKPVGEYWKVEPVADKAPESPLLEFTEVRITQDDMEGIRFEADYRFLRKVPARTDAIGIIVVDDTSEFYSAYRLESRDDAGVFFKLPLGIGYDGFRILVKSRYKDRSRAAATPVHVTPTEDRYEFFAGQSRTITYRHSEKGSGYAVALEFLPDGRIEKDVKQGDAAELETMKETSGVMKRIDAVRQRADRQLRLTRDGLAGVVIEDRYDGHFTGAVPEQPLFRFADVQLDSFAGDARVEFRLYTTDRYRTRGGEATAGKQVTIACEYESAAGKGVAFERLRVLPSRNSPFADRGTPRSVKIQDVAPADLKWVELYVVAAPDEGAAEDAELALLSDRNRVGQEDFAEAVRQQRLVRRLKTEGPVGYAIETRHEARFAPPEPADPLLRLTGARVEHGRLHVEVTDGDPVRRVADPNDLHGERRFALVCEYDTAAGRVVSVKRYLSRSSLLALAGRGSLNMRTSLATRTADAKGRPAAVYVVAYPRDANPQTVELQLVSNRLTTDI